MCQEQDYMAGLVQPSVDGVQHSVRSRESSLQQPIGCALLIKMMLKLSRQQTPHQDAACEPAGKAALAELVMPMFLPRLLFSTPVTFKRCSEKPGCGWQSPHSEPDTSES